MKKIMNVSDNKVTATDKVDIELMVAPFGTLKLK